MAEGGHYDIVILGGGSGGYACALRAAEFGKRVALIEKDKVGGTCLHRGCIPTKALLHAAEVADSSRESEKFGVLVPRSRASRCPRCCPTSRAWSSGCGRACRAPWPSRKIDVIYGDGRLASPTSVTVGGDDLHRRPRGARHRLRAEVAARARASTAQRIITSDDALRLRPGAVKSVIILGGGVIGVEFASVWRSFGAEVTIVEMAPQLLPLEDEASAKVLQRVFRRRGIAFELGTPFQSVSYTDAGVAGHPRRRQAARSGDAAGGGGPRPGLGRPRLRGERGHTDPRVRRRGPAVPDRGADHLRRR